jgi:hypothetical protein
LSAPETDQHDGEQQGSQKTAYIPWLFSYNGQFFPDADVAGARALDLVNYLFEEAEALLKLYDIGMQGADFCRELLELAVEGGLVLFLCCYGSSGRARNGKILPAPTLLGRGDCRFWGWRRGRWSCLSLAGPLFAQCQQDCGENGYQGEYE